MKNLIIVIVKIKFYRRFDTSLRLLRLRCVHCVSCIRLGAHYASLVLIPKKPKNTEFRLSNA